MHSIMCFHSVLSARWQSNQSNQCLCVLHSRQQPQTTEFSTCQPSPLISVLVLSISASVKKNHCEFHPSAITIVITACAFHSAHSTHWRSRRCNHTVAISACVCPTSASETTVPLCVSPAGHLLCNQCWCFSISAPVSKNHCAFHPSAITIAISACAFQSVHSTHWQFTVAIMCPTVQDLSKRTTASTLPESHQCNQCLCVLHPHQKPQSKACSTL